MPEFSRHRFTDLARRRPTVIDRVIGKASLRRGQPGRSVFGPQLRFPRAVRPVNRAIWTDAADAVWVALAGSVRDAMSNVVDPTTRMEA